MFLVKVLWSVNETDHFYTHPESSMSGLRSATQTLWAFMENHLNFLQNMIASLKGFWMLQTRPNPFHFQLSPFQSLALWVMKSVIVLKLPGTSTGKDLRRSSIFFPLHGANIRWNKKTMEEIADERNSAPVDMDNIQF